MNKPNLLGRLLIHLARRIQTGDIIDLFELSVDSGASSFSTLSALAELEHAGLVDARRLRLTLAGLTLAAALAARSGGRAESVPKSSRPASSARHAA